MAGAKSDGPRERRDEFLSLTWQDVEDIGFELAQAHPNEDPSQVPLPELLRLVTDLDDFEDDPERVDERTLTKIVAAWKEEFAQRA
jgi:FeS assembly protein IscX